MIQSFDMSLFVATMERGSFTAAAATAGITPSAVSKKIARLEARIGAKLLRRSTRRLELTAAGYEYLERARRILAEISAAEHSARHMSDTPRGSVRISCHAAFAERQLMPLLPEFLQRNPEIRVQILVGDRPGLPDATEADITVHSAVAPLAEYVSHRLAANPWVLCAAPGYLERHGAPAVPDDLKRHNCLIVSPSGTTHEEWLFRAGADVYPVEVAGNFGGFGSTVYEAAKAGLGIAKLAEFLVAADVRAGRLSRVLADFMPNDVRAIYLFYSRQRPTPLKIRALVEFLVARFTPMPPWLRDGSGAEPPL